MHYYSKWDRIELLKKVTWLACEELDDFVSFFAASGFLLEKYPRISFTEYYYYKKSEIKEKSIVYDYLPHPLFQIYAGSHNNYMHPNY